MTDSMPESKPFIWPARVYWEDTDAGGVVYHAAYLHFMERARTEWLRALGVDQSRLRADTGLAMMVRDMQLDFRAPARLDDALDVTVQLLRRRPASLVFGQSVCHSGRPGEPLVQASVRIACVDVDRMRPAPLPAQLLQRIPLNDE
ncbi:MAG: tol-pal system-associated acyl-CoA thioesterase [Rhodanobacteraceae bacterium]